MDLRQKPITMNKDCVYLMYFLCHINLGNLQVQQQATDKSLGTVLWRESKHLRNTASLVAVLSLSYCCQSLYIKEVGAGRTVL